MVCASLLACVPQKAQTSGAGCGVELWEEGASPARIRELGGQAEEMSELQKHDFMSGYVYPMAGPVIQLCLWDGETRTQLSLIANYPDKLFQHVWEAGSVPVGVDGDGVGVLWSGAGGV